MRNLARFLNELENYDPSIPTGDFVLVNTGARLLIELTGSSSFFGIFAQLNIYQVIDHLLERIDYLNAMDHLGEGAEKLTEDREVREMVKRLNQSAPDDDRLPNARRLWSYCQGNLVMAALDAALADDVTAEERAALVAHGAEAAKKIAMKDSSFEQVEWYRLAMAAAEAELLGNADRFEEKVERSWDRGIRHLRKDQATLQSRYDR